MATQRYISTSFWDDVWIQTLDPSEKLLFLYYMTNPLTNIAGVYKVTARRVGFDTGFTADTIGHIMQKFETARKVFRFGEYIVIPSWPTHQKWESKSKIKEGIVAVLSALDQETLQFLCESGFKFNMRLVYDTISIPYPYEQNYSEFDTDTEFDSDIEVYPKSQKASPLPDSPIITSADFAPEPETFNPESHEAILANLLLTEHRKSDPAFLLGKDWASVKRWSPDIEKLMRIDKRSFEEIKRVILWCQSPGCFWAANILSGSKLREKFPSLILQAQGQSNGNHAPEKRSTVINTGGSTFQEVAL